MITDTEIKMKGFDALVNNMGKVSAERFIALIIKEKFDYEEHGGAPLLGINGVSIVAHGSSGPKSIKNSIKLAQKCVESHLIEHTQTQFKNSIRGIA